MYGRLDVVKRAKSKAELVTAYIYLRETFNRLCRANIVDFNESAYERVVYKPSVTSVIIRCQFSPIVSALILASTYLIEECVNLIFASFARFKHALFALLVNKVIQRREQRKNASHPYFNF